MSFLAIPARKKKYFCAQIGGELYPEIILGPRNFWAQLKTSEFIRISHVNLTGVNHLYITPKTFPLTKQRVSSLELSMIANTSS